MVEKQAKSSHKADHLAPFQFKKGQSGNPNGRPVGKSLKEYTREMLAAMTDDERQDFLKGIPKIDIWKMTEGNPETKTDLTTKGEKIVLQLVNYGDNKPSVPTETLPNTTP